MSGLISRFKKIMLFVALILSAPRLVMASEAGKEIKLSLSDPQIMLFIILVLIIFIVLVMIYAMLAFRTFLNEMRSEARVGSAVAQEPALSWWQALKQKLTDAVPVEQEADVMTDHEYDGIRELDNNLPPWWKYMFYATIVFSVVYMAHYHIFNTGELQDAEYKSEVALAEFHKAEYVKKMADAIDETNVELLTEEARLASGEALYAQNCSACHGKVGEGGVGPNLVDDYWLHGGDIKDVFKVVKYGVTQKGMIAWQGQLSPSQMQEVSSYILSLGGTNPPNAKAPQGELYIAEKE